MLILAALVVGCGAVVASHESEFPNATSSPGEVPAAQEPAVTSPEVESVPADLQALCTRITESFAGPVRELRLSTSSCQLLVREITPHEPAWQIPLREVTARYDETTSTFHVECDADEECIWHSSTSWSTGIPHEFDEEHSPRASTVFPVRVEHGERMLQQWQQLESWCPAEQPRHPTG
jgi:hypothetical protein